MNRLKRAFVWAAILVVVAPVTASAQLAAADIQALQNQAVTEHWTFTVGENPATKRPISELCGFRPSPQVRAKGRVADIKPQVLPPAFDWRPLGGCTSVKDQDGCGSCWAFGTVGAFECNILIKDGIEVDLSEQWLVSCNQYGWGCGGGYFAHEYHTGEMTDPCGGYGAVYEADFPYAALDLPCNCPYAHPYVLDSWAYIGSGGVAPTADIKQAILDYGPVSVGIYVNSAFQAYTGGVFGGSACESYSPNHCVCLVGWDDSLGAAGAWILRNSWGPGWGEAGYMYIEYGCSLVGYDACFVYYAGSDDLLVTPAGGLTSVGPIGGPFTPGSETYTLTNNGPDTISWEATKNEAWIDLSSPSSGTLTAGDSITVTVTINSSANSMPADDYSDVVTFANLTSGAISTRVVVLDITPPVLYSEPLDSNPGWTTQGSWAFGDPTGSCGDPNTGHTGNNVYGYNLSGCYTNGMPEYFLTATPIDCSMYEGISLSFWRWLGVENAIFDDARVQVSSNGTTWTNVWVHSGGSFSDTSWTKCQYDISAVADGQPTVYIRWGMGPTDGSVTYGGWNIDDIELQGAAVDDLLITPVNGLVSSGFQGGPFSPDAIVYTLSNQGASSIDWTAEKIESFFDVTPAAGSLAPGDSTTVTVALNAVAATLAPGQYGDTVVFTNLASGITQARAVSLTVLAIPGEIDVTDSIPPTDDLDMPFGLVPVGVELTEQITIGNPSASPLTVSGINLGAGYQEDFNDGIAQGWVGSNPAYWSVTGGEYRAQAGALGVSMSSHYTDGDWQDLTYTATMRRTGDFYSVTAMFVRTSTNFVYPSIGSAYGVGITAEGSFWVVVWINGSYSWLSAGWVYSPYLNTGTTPNEVTLSISGNSIGVYFNGNLAWAGVDSSLTTPGSIALAGYSGSGPEAIDYFDNLAVSEPLSAGGLSPEQAWYNAHPVAAADLSQSPKDLVVPKFEGEVAAATALEPPCVMSSPFQLANLPTLPYVVAPGDSVTFDVIYAPLAAQDDLSAVNIVSDDPDEPEVVVTLSATAYMAVNIVHTPLEDTTDLGPYDVTAEITAPMGLARAEMNWSNDGGATFDTVTMAPLGGDLYNAQIPAQAIGANVCYYIECEDTNGDIITAPIGAPVELYCFTVYGIPNLEVVPTSLLFRLLPDQTGSQSISLSNTGTWPADWTITDVAGLSVTLDAAQPAPDPGRRPAIDWAPEHAPDTLLVGFRRDARNGRGVSVAAAAAVHAAVGARVAHTFKLIPVDVVRVPNGANLQAVAAAYRRFPEVAYVEPNYKLQAIGIPDDPMFDQLWGMNNTGQTGGTPDADIDVPEAWDITTGSANVVVGVIDTGCDYNHEDLAAPMWTNEPELNGIAGIDDDANGIVDDIYGAKWINGDGSPSSGNPMDDHYHGTHTSGTVGAAGNNAVGVAGVNWNVRIMALKFLDSGGGGWTADAISAIEYAIAKGANLTSNSWGGGGYDQSLKDAIDTAGAAGQLFVVAAGNGNTNTDTNPYYPSCYESANIISVAASDHYDLKADFSNWGVVTVDLAAPGVGVLSSIPGNSYTTLNGTSMATPHVAGVAALLLSLAPGTDPLTVKDWILNSVDVLPQWSGVVLTSGRLNAANAVALAGVSWLSEDPVTGTLAPSTSTTIWVTADAAGLPNGYIDSATLLISGDPDGPLTVDVDLVVSESDFVVTPPEPFESAGPNGGPFDPVSKTYTLINVGASPINWTAADDASWLDVTPASGTLDPGASTSVTAALNSLADYQLPGLHVAQITFTDSTNGVSAQRDARLSIDLPAPVTFYNELMDADPGWLTEGMWEFGVPQGECYDTDHAYTGSNVYGFNFAGCYPNNMPEYFLTSAPINCSGFANVTLSFFRWLTIEDATADHARVQVSNDAVTWADVWTHTGITLIGQWTEVAYDISDVADGQPTVYIRWGMGPTNGSVVYGGWNIDDVQLQGSYVDALVVSPAEGLDASGCEGGPFEPPSVTYTVTNAGPVPVDWTAAATQAWVDASPAGGTLGSGESAAVTVSLNSDANSLPGGLYSDTVTFANTASGASVLRSVRLDVYAAPPAPANPAPEDGATGVMVDADLAWNQVIAADQQAHMVPVVFSDSENTSSWGPGEQVAETRPDTIGSGATTIVIYTTAITGSVMAVLDSLGVVYDSVETIFIQYVDLAPYSTIIVAAAGGMMNEAGMAHLAASVNAGAKLVFLGGSCWEPFANGLNTSLIGIDVVNYCWDIVYAVPNLSVVQPGHPLAADLPSTYNFADFRATYYMARITDPAAVVVATNGDGYPALVTKPLGAGELIYFINAPYQDFWGYPDDLAILQTILTNALGSTTCATMYDVYLGLDPASMSLIAQDLLAPYCDPGALTPLTTHYWRVVARNCCAEVPGPVWSFTTGDCIPPDQPSQPDPADGAIDVPVDIPYASWVGGGQGSCSTTYDVYAGFDPDLLELIASGLTDTVCPVPGPLPYDTQCYWQVIAINCCGQIPGPVWTFRTENGPTPIYTWDFENGLGGFTLDNNFGDGNGLWHLSTACLSVDGDHTAPTSLYYGLDPSCNFDAGLTEGVVTSPPIDLAYVTAPIAMALRYYLQTEGAPSMYDKASVELSVDGGPFQTIAHNDYNMGVYVLSDPTYAWQAAELDLSTYAGSTVQARFHFETVDGAVNQYPGFYVDDVQIIGVAPDVQIVHQPLTDTTSPGPYPVCADIVSDFTLARAELFWSLDGGATFSTVPLVNAGGVSYCAEIPGQPVGAVICYYLEAEDVNGYVARHPADAPSSLNCFVREGIPNLVVDPDSLAFTMAPESEESQIINLSNTGDWPVEWSLREAPGGVSSVTAAVTRPAMSYSPATRRPVDVDWSKPHDPNTLLVGFKPGTDTGVRASAHALAGTSVAHTYQLIPVEVVRIPGGVALEQVAAAYAAMPDVAFVEPNYYVHAIAIPDDPMFNQLWGMNNTGQTGGTPDADIDAPEAWDIATGSADVIVGVIDTGTDYNHVELASQMWANEPELNGLPGVDDDANGIVDDIHGAKWINGDGSPTSGDPMDDYGHGTHTAGTIGAAGNNSTGVAGVNWNVRIMALKFLDSSGGGWTADAIAAVEYAILKGANLTSNSWSGGGYDQSLKDIIDAAGAAGQLFVAAAGNDYMNTDTYPVYPSCYDSPNIISVAASDHNDQKADFSNWGALSVDLAAPGVDVLSSIPGNSYTTLSGTSMATPHVAGVAALLLSIAPGADPLTLKDWILDSVDVLPQWSGGVLTGGRLNAANAVMLAGTPWLTEDPTSGVLGPDESIQIQVSANTAGLPDGYADACTLSISGDPDGPLEIPVSLNVFDLIGIIHTPLEDTTLPGPYAVCADIIADAGLVRTDLNWSIDGTNFTTVPMANTGADTYCAEITAQPIGTIFTYYIEAEDVDGNVRTKPRNQPWLSFQYQGIPNLVVTPDSLEFVVPPEDAQTQTLILQNNGTWPAEWSLGESVVSGSIQLVLPALPGGAAAGAGWLPNDWVAPPRPEIRTVVSAYTGAASLMNVLLLVADEVGMIQQIQGGLAAFPDIGAVDYCDLRYTVPSLDQLNAYDCVLVATNYGPADSAAAGNVLADYVDAGGTVVEMAGSFGTGGAWELHGRFVTENYGAFIHGPALLTYVALGSYDPAHPIMAGVSTMTEELSAGVTIQPDAAWVASWNDGTPLIATKDSVVAINSFPFDYGSWTGDLILVVHNAITWLGGDWLSATPTSGVLEPAQSVEISVTADAAGLEEGFHECKNILIQGDPDGPLEVPVCLSVGDCAIPTANFAAEPTAGCAPLYVQFTDLSTGSPTSWLWDFGDGATSTEQHPVHVYDIPGSYTVSLTATNDCGSDTHVEPAYIQVEVTPDSAFTADPIQGCAPLSVQFTDLSAGGPTSWLWEFGDGTSSAESNPNHIYMAPGLYSVSLTVANSCGSNVTTMYEYIAVSGPPQAAFSNSTAGCAPAEVCFFDESTGSPTAWAWDFGDGATSIEQNPCHTFADGGYTVCLTASNGCGSDTVCTMIVIPGALNAEFSGTPTTGNAPLEVQFSDLSTGAPDSWAWDFGDGATSTDQNPVHTYVAPGSYTVTLTVSSQCGPDTATKTSYINVDAPDMRANRAFWYFKYSPDCQTQDVQITIYNDGANDLTAIGVMETVPDGWAFDSLVNPPACAPAVVPPQGATGTLEFAWLCIPTFPYTFTYRLTLPADAAGEQFFDGLLLYRRSGPELIGPIGLLGSIAERVYHSIDYNPANHVVSLSELLRAIQFYNSGGYHYQPGTEDGYAPGVGSHDGPPHDADYNSQNWAIGLSELLRLIQFYNSGGYHVACGTEDGYAPGPAPSGADLAKSFNAAQANVGLNAARSVAAIDNRLGTLDLTVELDWDGPGPVTALSLIDVLPDGWTFNSVVDGDIPALAPPAGASGKIEFAWVWIPDLPATLTYRLNVPAGADPAQVAGQILYRTSGEELQANVDGSPAGVFYVDAQANAAGNGSQDSPFATVGAAVAALVAGRGDTILVRPGAYLESVVLKPATTLAGEGAPDSVLLTGAQGADAAVTMADACALRGLSIGTLKVPVAVRVTDSATVEIADCILTAGVKAIEAAESAAVTSTNNQVTEGTGTDSPLYRHD